LGSPLLFAEEFEVVIMIEVVTEEMHGSDRVLDLNNYERALGWYGRTFNESEMARSSECTG